MLRVNIVREGKNYIQKLKVRRALRYQKARRKALPAKTKLSPLIESKSGLNLRHELTMIRFFRLPLPIYASIACGNDKNISVYNVP